VNSVHITTSTVRPGYFLWVMETTLIVHCEPAAHLKIQGLTACSFRWFIVAESTVRWFIVREKHC
jgi:hypothetical protein